MNNNNHNNDIESNRKKMKTNQIDDDDEGNRKDQDFNNVPNEHEKLKQKQQKQQNQDHHKEDIVQTNMDANHANSNDHVDPLLLYKHSNLRHVRKSLANCMELHKRSMFNGLDEEAYYQQRIMNRTLKRQKLAETDLQRKFIQSTILRKGRIDKLNQLTKLQNHEQQYPMDHNNDDKEIVTQHPSVDQNNQVSTICHKDPKNRNQTTHHSQPHNIDKKQIMVEYMIPDGHVETEESIVTCHPITTKASHDDHQPPSNNNTAAVPSNDRMILLPKLRSCYVCKKRYRELHPFYDQLCPECATLNWKKRHQSVNLHSKIAIVTGSRVKIGYQVRIV
jgi:hypothetical protein